MIFGVTVIVAAFNQLELLEQTVSSRRGGVS